MKPDLVWLKNADNAYTHKLFDSVRGPNKVINSNNNSTEEDANSTSDKFNSDGFTIDTSDGACLNANLANQALLLGAGRLAALLRAFPLEV